MQTISNAFLVCVLGLLLPLEGSCQVWLGDMQSAFRESSYTGRPLLVVVTRDTCGPCRKMKQLVTADPSTETLRQDFLIVFLDLENPDFRELAKIYPIAFDIVPMVYLISPDKSLLYGQPGALELSDVESLRVATMRITGKTLSATEIVEHRGVLDRVRIAAAEGNWGLALRLNAPLAEQHSLAATVRQAQRYERQLLGAIERRAAELDQQLSQGNQVFRNAFELVNHFVSVPGKYAELKDEMQQRIRAHEIAPQTRTAMLQAKGLVRAYLEERRKMPQAAVDHYLQVVRIDPNTPAGRSAMRRAERLRHQPDRGKQTSHGRVGPSTFPAITFVFRQHTAGCHPVPAES